MGRRRAEVFCAGSSSDRSWTWCCRIARRVRTRWFRWRWRFSFLAGILAGADKLTRIAHLRHGPVLPEILGVKRLPSHSTLSRFWAGMEGVIKELDYGFALRRLLRKVRRIPKEATLTPVRRTERGYMRGGYKSSSALLSARARLRLGRGDY